MRTLFIFCSLLLIPTGAFAQPEDYSGVVAKEQWTVLHLLKRANSKPIPFPKTSKLISLKDFQVTGPMPGHSFVLGNFAADGEWGLVDGYIQRLSGNNAVMEFGWADQFELEGIAEHANYGGWFLLVGFDEGHGHGVINCNMKESGSPWFLTRFRANKAVPDSTVELDGFDWKREQPFKVVVKDNKLSLTIGKFDVLQEQPLEGYSPGRIIFGVYETRYGTKPIRFKSLRLKSLPSAVIESEIGTETIIDSKTKVNPFPNP